jgi:hypothetical protein
LVRIPRVWDLSALGTGDPCPDFTEVIEEGVPVGGAYYNGVLVLDTPAYLTTEERLELIDTHPLFTGVCPKCK